MADFWTQGAQYYKRFMSVAGQWKDFERRPKYSGTRLNKAYLPPEKSFLRRRPFKFDTILVVQLS